MRHAHQRPMNGQRILAKPSAISEEFLDEIGDLLQTTVTERDRIELEHGTTSRYFAIRQEERWGRL